LKPSDGGSLIETVLVVGVIVLALAAAGVGAWALSLRRQIDDLNRELAAAREHVARLAKLGALGEMASSFAHAFNDVLTPIIGRTQLLLQRMTDPQLREWLETIERAALDGARTVRRIQEFMQKRREEPAVAVDLGPLVRQAAAEATHRQQAVGIKTDVDSLPLIAGDPLALREALDHILANALEAAPEASQVSLAARMDGGDAVVSVSDSGSGMTGGVQARIFEPFFTTKPGAKGLGLCLAQGIVARHGGQIDIESAPGRGTTVRIKFPVEGVTRPKTAKMGQGPRQTKPGGLSRCLVVDDDPQVRQMISDILSNAGHAVVVAVDGSDGVEKFKEDSSVEIVITDLAMPKLNGLQLARACKTLRPAVPVVMLTGWGVLLTEDELSEHGVDEVLSKPVRMDQLLGVLAAVRARAAAGTTE
jgi:CheY-like chemotaxis protein/nitrogen-specific signal transduction histidine kinase